MTIFAKNQLPFKMKKEYQWLILLAGVLLLVVSNAINFGPENEMSWQQKISYLLILTVVIAVQFFSVFAIGKWMQHRMPGLPFTYKRIIRSFAISIPLLAVLMTLSDLFLQYYSDNPVYAFGWKTLLLNLTQSAVTALYILGLSEAFYHYDQLNYAEKEKDELLRINLMAQYDSLKQQVSPHFLFNSLNSLSSLISIDPAQAEKFVEEMSEVYRYLLQSNQDELTTLGRELDFIKSYVHLLKTRFGEGLQVEIDVAEGLQQCHIPPLTLQLLVENAVKHNETSTTSPLYLRIFSQGNDRLAVVNNLQRRTITLPSAKVGLANVIARYRLLSYPYVEIRETETEFTVLLPLIR
jgi:sensor histidine kinase YesM